MKVHHHKWRYQNTTLLLISLVALFLFLDIEIVHTFIQKIETYGYLGAFITGIFFVSTFTVAPASIVLFHLSQDLNQLLVALCTGLGAVVGDFLIFKILKDNIFEEIKPLLNNLGGSHVYALMHTPYFAWFMPVFGAIIVASPLPDEIGIGMMGLSKIKSWQFLGVSFVLNATGIFLITSLASVL
ncbi:MAG: hypothetical protein WCT07_00075 [Candidatus Paceibacterota bacterium]|jgi:hypothetical protein